MAAELELVEKLETAATGRSTTASGGSSSKVESHRGVSSGIMMLTFFVLGTTVLFPWNGLLSSASYIDEVIFKEKGWISDVLPAYTSLNVMVQATLLVTGGCLTLWKLLALALPCGAGCALLCMYSLLPNVENYELALRSCYGIAVVAGGILQSGGGELGARLVSRHNFVIAQYSNGIAFAGIFSACVFGALSFGFGNRIAVYGIFALMALLFTASLAALLLLVRRGELDSPAEAAAPEVRSAGNGISILPLFGSLARGWPQELNLFLMYVQTFLVFPKACLQAQAPSDIDAASYGFILMTTFQVFDLVGRVLLSFPAVMKMMPSGKKVWMVIAARSLLVPLFFMICNAKEGFLANPIVHIIAVMLWAATNGMITTVCFICGTSEAAVSDRDVIGRALPLCLTFGISAGLDLSGRI